MNIIWMYELFYRTKMQILKKIVLNSTKNEIFYNFAGLK
jgi:hypothetical protein